VTQIGEPTSVSISSDGKEECIFCGKKHQNEKPAPSHAFERNMNKLKSEGRSYTIENYSSRYPSENQPPLVEWQSDIHKARADTKQLLIIV
jgi:hypothetical protein